MAASWLNTYRQAQAVETDVGLLRSALTARDWGSAAAQLPGALDSSRALASSTQGLPWRVLEAVPVIGGSASAAADLAGSVSALLSAAEPLVPYAESVVTGQVRRDDGSVDLDAVRAVAPLLAHLASVMDAEVFRLDQVDVDGVRPQIAAPLVELRDQLRDSRAAVAAAAPVAERIPAFLGADGERTWLVLLQNPAEARGTGGFPGGYVILSADGGRLTIVSAGKSNDLSRVSIPTEGAPADARLMWGSYLEFWNTFNLSADFPMVAGLAAAGMDARGTPVDGVIAVDPRAVAALLAVAGPVTVDGQTVTAENAERFFTVDAYRLYPESNVRDALTLKLVGEILRRFLASPWNPIVLADALREPFADGRVRVWSSDPAEEAWLQSTAVGGGVPDTPGSVIAVAFDNAAGNKMDAFVATGVDYRPGRCPAAEVQQSSVSVSLRNDAPVELPLESGNYGRADDPRAPEGSTKLLVYVYAPVGSTFVSSTLDTVPSEMFSGQERGRPVWWNYVTLQRGEAKVIDIRFDEPSVPDVEPAVLPQAMVIDEQITIKPDYSCS